MVYVHYGEIFSNGLFVSEIQRVTYSEGKQINKSNNE